MNDFQQPTATNQPKSEEEEEEKRKAEQLDDDETVDVKAEEFPDFNVDELMGIAKIMLREEQYNFSDEAEEAFREYLERRMEQPRFANARSVRNALERARLRQASRVVNEMDEVGKDDLMHIEAEDILQSRVFSDQDEGQYGQAASGNGSKTEESNNGKGKAKGKSADGKAEADGDGQAQDRSDDGEASSESESDESGESDESDEKEAAEAKG